MLPPSERERYLPGMYSASDFSTAESPQAGPQTSVTGKVLRPVIAASAIAGLAWGIAGALLPGSLGPIWTLIAIATTVGVSIAVTVWRIRQLVLDPVTAANADVSVPHLILLVRSGQQDDSARCREHGIDAYLSSAGEDVELLEMIRLLRSGATKGDVITRHTLEERRRPLRLLVAEDNPVNQRLATVILEKEGHQVLLAED